MYATETLRDRAPSDGHDNESGPSILGWGNMDQHYGRRIEADGTWTVYHVFTGAPADIADHMMTGLDQTDATDRMLFLNAHNAARRGARRAYNQSAIGSI